jgi:chromatin remodeling complex protein RSC6
MKIIITFLGKFKMIIEWTVTTPTNISQEFAIFSGKNQLSMIEISKTIMEYIKNHDLRYPGSPREIIPDQQLRSALGIEEYIQVVTYPEIQMYIKENVIRLAYV